MATAVRDPLRLLRVEHAVSGALAESRTSAEAFDRCLEAVAGGLGWEYGALWIPAEEGLMRCVADWHAPGSRSESFALLSRGLAIRIGEGLPGRVFAAEHAAWIPDVAEDPDFPRAEAAALSGLRAAYAFPLSGEDGVHAVVEVFSTDTAEPEPEMLDTLLSVGRRTGQFLERRRSERLVASSEARKRAILDAALDCVITIDHEGRVVEANPALETIFGWSVEAARGREMAELIVPPGQREAHRSGLARVVGGGAPHLLGRRVELTAIRRDGSEIPVELAISRIDTPGPPLFTGHVRDITDRKQAIEELRASRARMVEAADDARRRIERDLHDGAQQRLVALALELRLIEDQLRADPERAATLLAEARGELDAATTELRELARGIHPAVLTDQGLGAALAGLARRMPLRVELDVELEERLPAPVEAAAYFVAAEALANAVRHAEAGRIAVTARHADGALTVSIRDDGRGGAETGSGSGLRGLVDRLATVDGRMTVVSPPGEGTHVTAVIPCAS